MGASLPATVASFDPPLCLALAYYPKGLRRTVCWLCLSECCLLSFVQLVHFELSCGSAAMSSLAACQAITQYGKCLLALCSVSPKMRVSTESTGGGFRSDRLTLRLKMTSRMARERHLTLIVDEALFRLRGLDEGALLEKSMWWLLRRAKSSLHRIPLHVVTNTHKLDFLGAARPLVVSLYILCWQMAQLELPQMPLLHTLELRNCSCLRSICLHPQWGPGEAGHAQVPTLQVLDLGETAVHSLYEVVKLFPGLEVLYVDGCESIQDWAEAVNHLGRLRELNATATKIKELSWLPQLRHLRVLKLHGCGEIVDWSPVGQLHRLRELNCNYGSLANIEWIVGCADLEQLFLYGCTGITDGSPIGQLSFLRRLNIGLHNFSNIAWLSGCRQLQSLWMQGAASTPVSGVDSIGELKNLQVLNMAYSAMRDIDWLPRCTALRELYLVGCSHVMSWQPLGQLLRAAQGLLVVDLREANVFGIREWVQELSRIQEIRLEETNLTPQDRIALSLLPTSVRVVL